MDEIHFSLKGIDDINQNQKALFYYWRGRSFVIHATSLGDVKTPDMSNMVIDFLENYALPAYQKAESLLPSYTAAMVGISNTQKWLRKVKNPKEGLFSQIFGSKK
jgi:hypothetical protein